MRAAWFDQKGLAADVFRIGDIDDVLPRPGEVRVRITYSGVNPGDIKKRESWLGLPMPYPRIIPHSDGAGVIDVVGAGVDPSRIGRRVWVYGAQSYRPFGTAAELTVVPSEQAIDLPSNVSDEIGATLGIPGITAHRAVFADGKIAGRIVLINGVRGAVGSIAAALASWGGAMVIGTVRRSADLEHLDRNIVNAAIPLDQPNSAAHIRSIAPDGVDRIIEVDLAGNAELDAQVVGQSSVIATYNSSEEQTRIPFWPLLFSNVSLQLIGSDDFSREVKLQAARDLTAIAAEGRLSIPFATPYPLERIADAHEAVGAGAHHGRVLIAL